MILHDTFGVNSQGHLTVAGLDALELAHSFGTPAYVIDSDKVLSNMTAYKRSMSEYMGGGSMAFYASKALSYKGIYRLAAKAGVGVDCASSGELYTARSVGFPMSEVCFHGNNKTDADLRFAADCRVGRVAVDCMEELCALDRIAGEYGVKQNIILRLTPGIDPHTHKKISTGGVDSKFGAPIATGAALSITRAALECKNLNLLGFHCHIGSQITEIQPFADAADIMLAFMQKCSRELCFTAVELTLGGGFGVKYIESDGCIDIEQGVKQLAGAIKNKCASLGMAMPEIHLEPGRSVVAAAGVTLYECGSVREIENFRNYVSIDGGMTDNPRYTLYGSQYTVVNATHAAAPADFVCTLAGRCCESGDLIGEGLKMAKPTRGDIIAVLVTGAYNYSMASNYNRVPRPPIVEISGGRAAVAVRRESFEDITALDL